MVFETGFGPGDFLSCDRCDLHLLNIWGQLYTPQNDLFLRQGSGVIFHCPMWGGIDLFCTFRVILGGDFSEKKVHEVWVGKFH